MDMVRNEIIAEWPRLWFICRCGLCFRQLTELVNHYEDRHSLVALAPYIPAKFQKEA